MSDIYLILTPICVQTVETLYNLTKISYKNLENHYLDLIEEDPMEEDPDWMDSQEETPGEFFLTFWVKSVKHHLKKKIISIFRIFHGGLGSI